MEYKVVTTKGVPGLLGLNIDAAVEKLASEVNQQIALGWEPQGGVHIGGPQIRCYLFQAMIKRR